MLREPRQSVKSEPVARPRTNLKKGRFQLVKLEERIAPACRTNPQGKKVGNCNFV